MGVICGGGRGVHTNSFTMIFCVFVGAVYRHLARCRHYGLINDTVLLIPSINDACSAFQWGLSFLSFFLNHHTRAYFKLR